MLFSVVIPVYNVELYLRECLDSVLLQTYSDFEVICVNDGSTDGSLPILEEYSRRDNRVTVVSQENRGQSVARNVGMRLAKGEYIMFVDSDDWISNNSLETLSKHVSGQDFIAFNCKGTYGQGLSEWTGQSIDEPLISGWDYYEKYAIKRSGVAFVSVFLRCYNRSFLMENNLFFKEGIFHEDTVFVPLVCYCAKKITSITDVLCYYRVREGSTMTSSSNAEKRKRDSITAANMIAAFFSDKKIEKTSLNRYVAGMYLDVFSHENKMAGERELLSQVDWSLFRSVCTFPRHKWLYCLLRVSPTVLRSYLSLTKSIQYFVKN